MIDLLTALCSILTLITVFLSFWQNDFHEVLKIDFNQNPQTTIKKQESYVENTKWKSTLLLTFSSFSLFIFFFPIISLCLSVIDGIQLDFQIIPIKCAYIFAYVYNCIIMYMIIVSHKKICAKYKELKIQKEKQK